MMGDKSKIEWTEATWNPTTGCSRVSAGCDNCYAIRQAARIQEMGTTDAYDGTTRKRGNGKVDWTGVLRMHEDRLDQPLRWKRPRVIFVNSMSDLFHPSVPVDFIDRVFAVMALCPQHTFQVLTKRPERAAEYMATGQGRCLDPGRFGAVIDASFELQHRGLIKPFMRDGSGAWWPLANVWIGTSVEDQAAADDRIPHLLRCPAAVRFLSCEPLLGPMDLVKMQDVAGMCANPLTGKHHGDYEYDGNGIQWVIVGGESGPGARPFNIQWARSIIAQCRAAGVACFVKQLGAKPYDDDGEMSFFPEGCERLLDRKGGDPSEWPADLRIREMPDQMEVA